VTGLLEFQVVGAPILDEQLTEVRSTLLAVACANGASSLDSWLAGLHRFERIQLTLWGSRQGQAAQDALRESEERERTLGERELQSRQMVAQLEHECEQVRKERDQAQRGVQDLQTALEERSRQADNWRAMYEALKNGGRVPIPSAPHNASGASNRIPLLPSAGGTGGPNKMLRASEPTPGSVASGGFQLPQLPGSTFNAGVGSSYGGPDNAAGRMRSSSTLSNDPSHAGGFDAYNRGFTMRSNSLPIRPPTRDSLASLLNRSVVPRTSAPGGNNGGGFRPPSSSSLGPPPPALQQLHDPVRSTFFAPASLRAMSPAAPSLRGGGMYQ